MAASAAATNASSKPCCVVLKQSMRNVRAVCVCCGNDVCLYRLRSASKRVQQTLRCAIVGREHCSSWRWRNYTRCCTCCRLGQHRSCRLRCLFDVGSGRRGRRSATRVFFRRALTSWSGFACGHRSTAFAASDRLPLRSNAGCQEVVRAARRKEQRVNAHCLGVRQHQTPLSSLALLSQHSPMRTSVPRN